MVTFFVALALLFAGYHTYGRLAESLFGPDDRLTPAVAKADGVDFVEMPVWKVFLIQLLNIAGTGRNTVRGSVCRGFLAVRFERTKGKKVNACV